MVSRFTITKSSTLWNDDIEKLGLNSGTYWDDLATTLLNVIGLY